MEPVRFPNMTANLSSAAPPYADDPDIWSPVHAAVMAIILALAFFGNTSICWIILTDHRLRSVPNTLVLNLAVCGLFTVLANGPLVLLVLSGDSASWTYGHAACQFNGFTTSVYGLASVLTLALISVNRYQMVRRSTGKFASWFNRSSVKLLIGGVWLLSALLSLPPVVGWSQYEFIRERAICTLKWSTEITYTVFVFTLGIFLPFVVMVTAYGAIFRLVRKNFKRMRSHSTRRNDAVVARTLSNSSFSRYLHAAADRSAARRSSQQSGGPLQADSIDAVSGAFSGAVSSTPPGPLVTQAFTDATFGDKDVTPTSPTRPVSASNNTNQYLTLGVHNTNMRSANADITTESRFLQGTNQAPECDPRYTDQSLTLTVPDSNRLSHRVGPTAAAAPAGSGHSGARRALTGAGLEKQQAGSVAGEPGQAGNARASRRGRPGAGVFSPPKDDLRVTVMVCAVLASFVLCWLPITFINFLESAWDGDVSPALNIFSVYMMFATSAINPLIYGVLNRKFRSGFRRFFRCGFLGPRGACRCCLSTKAIRQNRVSVLNVKE